MDQPILIVNNLTTQLSLAGKPVTIVDNISFCLYPSKTLAIVGESGCGKTMTALSLMRILPHPPALPPTGEVIYKDKKLLEISEKEMRTIRGGRIAMIFQDPTSALNPVYTVGNQLAEVAELHLNLFGDDADERSMQALREVGIADVREVMDVYPHQLSGGMRQRVMIAMALMCEPDILIADEPTTALDVTIQAQVLQLIRDLQQKRGMALLLITHDMGVVADIADEVIVMYAGQVVESGGVRDIFDKLAHTYTQGLFASRSSIHKPKSHLHGIKGSVPSPSDYPKGCRFHPRCPFVMDRCRHGDVPVFNVGLRDHTAKCWLYDGTEESLERILQKEKE
jgi:oligopeptide/dipeptide ABC transporter ATP-binding protein